jgi:hypothetical protein
MTQTELTKRPLTQVGEAIPHELGAQMIKNYQAANPTDVKNYYIGRNIIDQILAQPSCVGISFHNAYNEKGEKTLVYTGVDECGKSIIEYTIVTAQGGFDTQKAIVADRVDNDTNENLQDWIEKVFA